MSPKKRGVPRLQSVLTKLRAPLPADVDCRENRQLCEGLEVCLHLQITLGGRLLSVHLGEAATRLSFRNCLLGQENEIPAVVALRLRLLQLSSSNTKSQLAPDTCSETKAPNTSVVIRRPGVLVKRSPRVHWRKV